MLDGLVHEYERGQKLVLVMYNLLIIKSRTACILRFMGEIRVLSRMGILVRNLLLKLAKEPLEGRATNIADTFYRG